MSTLTRYQRRIGFNSLANLGETSRAICRRRNSHGHIPVRFVVDILN
jgi:hypothetical protein